MNATMDKQKEFLHTAFFWKHLFCMYLCFVASSETKLIIGSDLLQKIYMSLSSM